MSSPKVLKAIDIMKTFLSSGVSLSLKVKEINMNNIKQIVLITEKGLKVQLGANEFDQKLENLSVILKERKTSVDEASYVDLRFGGVIIRPKRV